MILTIEFWTLVSLSVTFLGAVIGIVWKLIRGVLQQAMQRINERLEQIDSRLREDADQWKRVERELLLLKAELPISYVRREDYITNIATIMTKLDAMSLKFENILLKGGKTYE